MRGFLSVFKREIKSYFATPLAYVFLVVFLVASTLMTFWVKKFFESQNATMQLFFENMPVLFICLAPAIAMRLWAEERRSNSIEVLFTLPITTTQAVLGKFFAAWTVLALALVLTCPMIFTVTYLGDPDPGPIMTGYLASFLMAGAFLAIGSFFSCLTRNQVIALVLAVATCSALLFAGYPNVLKFVSEWTFISAALWQAIAAVLERISLMSRFNSLLRGVIEWRDLAFFLLLGAGWLWANVVALRERRATG